MSESLLVIAGRLAEIAFLLMILSKVEVRQIALRIICDEIPLLLGRQRKRCVQHHIFSDFLPH